MPTEKKEETIKKIEGLFSGHKVAIVTDYRGMTVSEMGQLRRQLRDAKVEYHVIKNTLASIAADNTGKEGLKGFLEGPTAIAFSSEEATGPSKILVDYIRSSKAPLSIKGGLMDKRIITSEEVSTLATLPPTEVLISQVMAQIQAPISSFLSVLSANMRGFVGVLQARKQQLEGG